MNFDPKRHHRRSTRLRGYNYSRPGAYFITICTLNRECLFGEVANGNMRLNNAGLMVRAAWEDLTNHYPFAQLDAFVVMPNHVHGIVVIAGAGLKPAPTIHGLPEIIRGFKTFSARRINEIRDTPGVTVWQRNYYEHIIRDEESLHRIRQYIVENPARWASDRENSTATTPEPESAWLSLPYGRV